MLINNVVLKMTEKHVPTYILSKYLKTSFVKEYDFITLYYMETYQNRNTKYESIHGLYLTNAALF